MGSGSLASVTGRFTGGLSHLGERHGPGDACKHRKKNRVRRGTAPRGRGAVVRIRGAGLPAQARLHPRDTFVGNLHGRWRGVSEVDRETACDMLRGKDVRGGL